MSYKYTFGLLALLLLAACAQEKENPSLTFQRLLCNGMEQPRCVDDLTPTFSWAVRSTGFNKQQSAYQLQVATTAEKLRTGDADMWDSGKVSSSQSAYIKYDGEVLVPIELYYWKVKIWDEEGKVSAWSEEQVF
ncbi:MAG: hypothetical protein AAF223_18430, partial [Bacteroidota bacterium]